MKIFITGTDTNAGKTIVSSWLCLKTGYDYFKPIQTGVIEGMDSDWVRQYSGAQVHPESCCYQSPISPHFAAIEESRPIELDQIRLPASERLVIEGAGGLLTPVNEHALMIDLIRHLNVPMLLVVPARVGMINQALMALEVIRSRHLPLLGVIVSGEGHDDSCQSIETYGNTRILAKVPFLRVINQDTLGHIPMGRDLDMLLRE
jgi:dethiobiotin synthetase